MSKLRCFDDQGNRLFVSKGFDAGNLWASCVGRAVEEVSAVGCDDWRTVVASYGPKALGEWNQWAAVEGDVLLIVSSARVSN